MREGASSRGAAASLESTPGPGDGKRPGVGLAARPPASPFTVCAALPNVPTESEQWFDEYLDMHGYTYKCEPDLGVPKAPDRLIDRIGIESVCEIKEFGADAMTRRWPEGGRQMGTFSTSEWMLGVRRQITNAAEQLEPLSGRGWPLVIVLANPQGFNVPLEAPTELLEAMYGDLQVTFPLDTTTGSPAGEPQWVLGGGGRLVDFKDGEVGEIKAPWSAGWRRSSAAIGLRTGAAIGSNAGRPSTGRKARRPWLTSCGCTHSSTPNLNERKSKREHRPGRTSTST